MNIYNILNTYPDIAALPPHVKDQIVAAFNGHKYQQGYDGIMAGVCYILGVNEEDLRSKSKRRELVEARAIYSYIRDKEGASLVDIGRCLNRGHATVIHYLNNVISLREVQKKMRDFNIF